MVAQLACSQAATACQEVTVKALEQVCGVRGGGHWVVPGSS